jgi:hypothetical protein
MTPQEKALQLIDAFDEYAESRISDNGRGFDKKYCSKQCALIAVDEIIQHIETSYHNEDIIKGSKLYWQEVKQEIEKL